MLNQLKLRQLEVLHAVITAQSISSAARLIKISQPSVSRTIQRLEDVLGVKLFERQPGRLVPTREALRIHAEVEPIMSKMLDLSNRIDTIISGEDDSFKVGAAPSICRMVAPVALSRLLEQSPGTTVFLDALATADHLGYLLREEGECALLTNPLEHPMILSRMVGQADLVAAIPRGHPLEAAQLLCPEDMDGVDTISFIDPLGPHASATRSFLSGRDVTPRTRALVRFAEHALALANEGVGVTLIDSFSAYGPVGEDVVLRPLKRPPQISLILHWNKNSSRSRFVEQFYEVLIETLGELGNSHHANHNPKL